MIRAHDKVNIAPQARLRQIRVDDTGLPGHRKQSGNVRSLTPRQFSSTGQAIFREGRRQHQRMPPLAASTFSAGAFLYALLPHRRPPKQAHASRRIFVAPLFQIFLGVAAVVGDMFGRLRRQHHPATQIFRFLFLSDAASAGSSIFQTSIRGRAIT